MDENVPTLSGLSIGQKVVVGEPKDSFGIFGHIKEIVPKDQFPIKVDARFVTFDLALQDFNKGWYLAD